jgi:hypothetical protein
MPFYVILFSHLLMDDFLLSINSSDNQHDKTASDEGDNNINYFHLMTSIIHVPIPIYQRCSFRTRPQPFLCSTIITQVINTRRRYFECK